MRSAVSFGVRLAVFAGVMVLLLVGVFQTIARPVRGDTDTFAAEFTDANGLKTGDDVRMYGVGVGKVKGLSLNGNHARVTFTLQRERPMFSNSTLAVRYQNLTGQRYVDIQQPPDPERRLSPSDLIGTEHTVPAFDVTTVFNGLQPVLREMTPGDLNQFATSMLAVIEGNGTGMGPALDAIDKLSKYTTDRQSVITTLVRNLGQVSDRLGGKSGNAIALLTQLTTLVEGVQQNVDGLVDFSLTLGPLIDPAYDLIQTLGLPSDTSDPDTLLRNVFPDPADAVAVLNRLPAVIQTMTALLQRNGRGVNPGCSRGNAEAPEPLKVLIEGQRIALCKE